MFSNTIALFFDKSSDHSRKIWVSLFFLAFLAVGLNIYIDFGVSWDEQTSRNNGFISLKYAAENIAPDFIARNNIFDQYPALHDYFDKDYGVVFELPLAFFEVLLGLNDSRDIYYFRHLMTFLVSFAGVFAVYKLAQHRFGDWRLGLLAALFLILSPRLFAESFYNNKDVVFMAMFAITMNTTVIFLQQPTIRMAFWHALATAVLIDVRIMGVILPVVTVFVMGLKLGKGEFRIRRIFVSLSFYLILSAVLTMILWPYLWTDPWMNFNQAFENMSKFRWDSSVLYLGQSTRSTELPWHYIPVWLGITTPVLYSLLFLTGTVCILRKMISRRWSLWKGDEEWQDLLFLGLFFSPVMAVILLESVLYDGWRQMYFIYPAFILIAIRGWIIVFRWQVKQYPVLWPAITALAMVFILLGTSVWMIKSHPFQNVYFNALAGRDVKTKFDVDYWGLSSRQGLQYIAEHDQRQTINIWAGSFLPLAKGKLLLAPDIRDRLNVVKKQENADYVVTQYRSNLTDYSNVKIPYQLIYQIEVSDEAILSVYKRKHSFENES